MIYTELTNKAMKLAYAAHEGQYDKVGVPYIFHPYHLAEQMNTETRVCIALLHDVVEDTDITIEQLRADFPAEVTEALTLLTHDKNVDYYDYVKGVCTNLDSAFVKLADLIHNMTETRLTGINIGLEKKNRWFQKYAKALYMVVDFIESQDYKSSSDKSLFQKILQNYEGRNRQTMLLTDCKPQKYLTDEQYAVLSKLNIEEQMKYFKIELTRSRTDTEKLDVSDTKYISLEEYMNQYKSLIISEGCIVGIFDINIDETYCKKRVQPFWVNGSKRYIKEYDFIGRSGDNDVSVREVESVRLVWLLTI